MGRETERDFGCAGVRRGGRRAGGVLSGCISLPPLACRSPRGDWLHAGGVGGSVLHSAAVLQRSPRNAPDAMDKGARRVARALTLRATGCKPCCVALPPETQT